jgi:hypothetical protein
MVFTIFGSLFVGKIKIKFSACCFEITYYCNCKNLPVNLFRKLVPAYRKPPMTLKVVPKAVCDSEKCSESRL